MSPEAARAAVVVGDDRVVRKEEVVEGDAVGSSEVEDVGRALTRPAGDEEHRSERHAGRREHLDMEGDRPRHGAAPVERHDHRRAEQARRRPARGAVGVAGRRGEQGDEEKR